MQTKKEAQKQQIQVLTPAAVQAAHYSNEVGRERGRWDVRCILPEEGTQRQETKVFYKASELERRGSNQRLIKKTWMEGKAWRAVRGHIRGVCIWKV